MPKRIRPKPRQATRVRPAFVPRVDGETAAVPSATIPRSSAPAAFTRPVGAGASRPSAPVADYSYVVKDLVRITIIAAILFGGMGVWKALSSG